jgi:tripartite-type tricarboxylate transporter receptor subunit TctC
MNPALKMKPLNQVPNALEEAAPSGVLSEAGQRRQVLGALLGAGGLALFGPSAHAQSRPRFPAKPITLWIPWPAGGATDIMMRLLAELASAHLGQRVVVENRAGAGGTLAMPILQQAAPDGYTIAQVPQPAFRTPHTTSVLWDPIRDTTPILQLTGVTFGVVVPAKSEFRSLDDVMNWARAHPGELSVSTNGVGTTPHVVMDDLFGRKNLSYNHIPYKGTSEQMVAVAAGQVMVGVNSTGFAPFVDSGQLRLLVTFGEHRTKRWPQVPTLKELGWGIVAQSPYGLCGPAGMEPEVVEILHQAFKKAAQDPAHLAEMAKYDQELTYLPPAEYARQMKQTFEAERRIVERLGLGKKAG